MELSNEYYPTKCLVLLQSRRVRNRVRIPYSLCVRGIKAPFEEPPPPPAVRVPDLPSPTSIRLLDIIESQDGIIRCSMRVVDLEDENLDHAAISYTWDNPITVYEEPMPDLTGLTFSEHAEQLPFTYRTSPMGPKHEVLYMVDNAKLHYYSTTLLYISTS